MSNNANQSKQHRMIITKSSRFARNTLDCLKYIRQLKDMNIPVLGRSQACRSRP